MLAKNLSSLRKNRHLTQEDVAKALNTSRTAYSSYEKGTSEPNASLLIKLADYFEVYIDDLLRSDLGINIGLPIFQQTRKLSKLLDDDVRILVCTTNSEAKYNIQYIAENDFNLYTQNYNNPNFILGLPAFQLPIFSNDNYRAFEIIDDSMPPLSKGSILIGKYVKYERELKPGFRYLLVVKELGLTYRRVYKHKNFINKNLLQYTLLADNPNFKPTLIEINSILEIWEMKAFIGLPKVYDNKDFAINERLQIIEQKLFEVFSGNEYK